MASTQASVDLGTVGAADVWQTWCMHACPPGSHKQTQPCQHAEHVNMSTCRIYLHMHALSVIQNSCIIVEVRHRKQTAATHVHVYMHDALIVPPCHESM